MKIETIDSILEKMVAALLPIGLLGFIASIGETNRIPFIPFGFLSLIIFGGAIFLRLKITYQNKKSSIKPQPKPTKSTEPTNPWIPAPEVKVKKEEDEIPEIWKEVLARRIR